MNNGIIKIEIHLFENGIKHIVHTEYRVFYDPLVYRSKRRSELTDKEKQWLTEFKPETIFHF